MFYFLDNTLFFNDAVIVKPIAIDRQLERVMSIVQ
jgi:hypothetical protein